ncbi:MAG TPA: hypothetical protein EYQ43_06965 [Methyloprofundus sp.]|nr:hypothetical protein [Methyloprofundus sp.]
MSKKTISEHKKQDPSLTPEQDQYSRREFILTSAKGLGVTALGVTAFGAASLSSDSAKVSADSGDIDTETGLKPIPRLASLTTFDPDTAVDTWSEPWTWRPDDWPGKQLNLTVVENASPIAITGTGFENVRPLLFSYGGITPGPTIRMPGDSTYYLQLRNLLGLDAGHSFVGPYPDPFALPKGVSKNDIPQDPQDDWCLGEHTNGVHSVHTTNMHTHGLHVRPGSNPDGSISDNIILRIMPQADFIARENDASADCRFLRVNEQVGDANYEFRLGDIGATGAPHPPGTHWYHPHSHGATHNQVASGMAGFFIVEGDVDEAVNEQLAGIPDSDPQVPTGPYQYRERLVFIQNVKSGNNPVDPDAPGGPVKGPTFPTVNGSFQPKVMTMQPGAIERWRVLNGSVDGRGYIRFSVLKGPLTICDNNQLGRINASGGCTPLDTSTIERLKQPLSQLAMDGVTLVRQTDNGGYEHYVKNLNFTAPPNPLDFTDRDTPQDRIDKIANSFANADNVKAAYNRPNEVMMAPANRADVFFQAPQLAGGETSSVYTVVAHFDILHNDNYEKGLRKLVFKNDTTLPQWPGDIIVAIVVVSGEPVKGGPIDVSALPAVPDYLIPISDEDLTVNTVAEANARGVGLGSFRTRMVHYSGWGNKDFPIIEAPLDFVAENPDLLNVTYGPITPDSDRMVVLPPNIRTMAIDGRKFDPNDIHPQMWLGSSEEWAVYNNSQTLWSDKINSIWPSHQAGKAVTRAQAEAENLNAISTTTVDHPFHIHVNPFWLSRVDVPIADGTLVNILPEPRWQDVTWLPRGRGRAIFRSRFPDYVGEYVNHCHILLHEDNGMMQLVEVVASASDSNYVARFKVTQANMSSAQVTALYPRVSLSEAFSQNGSFVDANTGTGQVFPGFDIPG